MGNAIWLILALPEWFFPTILAPMSAGLLTAIPATGVVCLVVGLIGATQQRNPRLLGFFLPALASEIFVSIAGAYRGQVPQADIPLYVFLGLQLVLIVGLVVYAKGARLSALALAIFSISYALFAWFIAAMAFADDWL